MLVFSSVLTLSLFFAADSKTIHDLAKQGAAAIPQLEPFLNDSDPQTRHEAVKAIAEIGSSACLNPLIRATEDNDPEVEIQAIDGLVNFYLPGYIKTGISGAVKRAGTAVKSRFADVNDQVIDGYVEVRPDVVKAIGKVTRNGGSLDARANGARALGILRAKSAIPDLTEALSTKDSTVIYESLKAFEKIRDPKSAVYISYLLKDLNEKVQLMAIETVGVLANRESLPALREALQSARNLKVQRAALSAMGKIPDPQYRDLYDHYMKDKDADLRGDAAEGIARLKNPSDMEPMVRAYAAENKPSAKLGFAFAAVALGRHDLGPNTPLRYLVSELKSKFFSGVAQGYLIELIRDPKVREGVYPVLGEASKEEKIQLAQIFGVSGETDTIKYLEVLQADPNVDVRDEAVRAMRTLKARIGH